MFSFAAGSAVAQDASPFDPPDLPAVKAEAKVDSQQLTPEMYRYIIDLQRYGGPTDLTRQRAQLKAQQRMERIAALKWYGLSNSRPVAGVTPFTGTPYSPRWRGNAANGDWVDRGSHRTIYIANEQLETGRR
jgi:hypothetical protein